MVTNFPSVIPTNQYLGVNNSEDNLRNVLKNSALNNSIKNEKPVDFFRHDVFASLTSKPVELSCYNTPSWGPIDSSNQNNDSLQHIVYDSFDKSNGIEFDAPYSSMLSLTCPKISNNPINLNEQYSSNSKNINDYSFSPSGSVSSAFELDQAQNIFTRSAVTGAPGRWDLSDDEGEQPTDSTVQHLNEKGLQIKNSNPNETGKKGSSWQKVDVFPFRKGRDIASQYHLPSQTEYTFRGQLLRYKGKWKKKWSIEWFLIQNNVLLSCSKEEPFLVKICLPLKNIQGIERMGSTNRKRKQSEDAAIFEVKYIEAGKKGTPQIATMRCRAGSPLEADKWVKALKRLWDKSKMSQMMLGDFVARENAAHSIQELHDTIKNGGLYQLATRLHSSIEHYRFNCIKQLFFNLKECQMQAKYVKDTSALEVKRQEAEDFGIKKAKSAERSAALTNLICKLTLIFQSKRNMELIAFKKKVDEHHNASIARGCQEMMIHTLIVQKEATAMEFIQWRKQRLKLVIEMIYNRLLKESFFILQTRSHSFACRKQLQVTALGSFVKSRIAQRSQAISSCIIRWKNANMIYAQQEAALIHIIQYKRQWDTFKTLRVWMSSCIVQCQRDKRCGEILSLILKKHETKILSATLYQWNRWILEKREIHLMELGSKLNFVNLHVVESFHALPRERACHLMHSIFHKVLISRYLNSFHALRTGGVLHAIKRRNIISGISLLDTIFRHQVQSYFSCILKYTFRKQKNTSLNVLMGAIKLSVALDSIQEKRLKSVLKEFQHTKIISSDEIISDTFRFITVISYFGQSKLLTYFTLLKCHSREVNFLRGLARYQCIQRIVHLSERYIIASLAVSFSRLVHYTSLPNRPKDHQTLQHSCQVDKTICASTGFIKEIFINGKAIESKAHNVVHSLPTTIQSSFTTSVYPERSLSSVLQELVWLGHGMSTGTDGRPEIFLQGHRIATKIDTPDMLIQPLNSNRLLWKSGYHSTLRTFGLKRHPVLSKENITLRNRPGIKKKIFPSLYPDHLKQHHVPYQQSEKYHQVKNQTMPHIKIMKQNKSSFTIQPNNQRHHPLMVCNDISVLTTTTEKGEDVPFRPQSYTSMFETNPFPPKESYHLLNQFPSNTIQPFKSVVDRQINYNKSTTFNPGPSNKFSFSPLYYRPHQFYSNHSLIPAVYHFNPMDNDPLESFNNNSNHHLTTVTDKDNTNKSSMSIQPMSRRVSHPFLNKSPSTILHSNDTKTLSSDTINFFSQVSQHHNSPRLSSSQETNLLPLETDKVEDITPDTLKTFSTETHGDTPPDRHVIISTKQLSSYNTEAKEITKHIKKYNRAYKATLLPLNLSSNHSIQHFPIKTTQTVNCSNTLTKKHLVNHQAHTLKETHTPIRYQVYHPKPFIQSPSINYSKHFKQKKPSNQRILQSSTPSYPLQQTKDMMKGQSFDPLCSLIVPNFLNIGTGKESILVTPHLSNGIRHRAVAKEQISTLSMVSPIPTIQMNTCLSA